MPASASTDDATARSGLSIFHHHRQIRRSAKTRSFERASQDARQLELELEAAARGDIVEKKSAHISLKDAVARHLAERATTGKAREMSGIRKTKRMLARLLDYCNSKGILFLKDCTADHLPVFRQTWTFKKREDGTLSTTWKVPWAMVKALYTRAHRMGRIAVNEAARLENPQTQIQKVRPPVPLRCF